MNKLLLLFLFLIITSISNAQKIPDSVFTKYNNSKTTIEKNNALNSYVYNLTFDSISKIKSLQLLNYFSKKGDELGVALMKRKIAKYYFFLNDFSAALTEQYEALNIFKIRNDTMYIIIGYIDIMNSYDLSNNYADAIESIKKALPYITTDTGDYSFSYAYNYLGYTYSQAFMPDSGIVYAQKAIAIDEKFNDTLHLGTTVSTLAENYIAKGDYDIALPFLRKSIEYYPEALNDGYAQNDFAQLFLGKKQYDSTLHYAYSALPIFEKFGVVQQILRTYEYLYKTFDQLGKADSANKYYRLTINLKDSIFSSSKLKSIELIKFKEQLHQQELAEKEQMIQEERNQNIQYALIAIGIIILLSLYLLLSRSFITNVKWIEFSGVIALLIVFEFINLLIHPFLESITHHSPALMLLSLVAIAALIVPLHHRLEHWATHKLVEKNKAIRLAKAKKTIEELEKPTTL